MTKKQKARRLVAAGRPVPKKLRPKTKSKKRKPDVKKRDSELIIDGHTVEAKRLQERLDDLPPLNEKTKIKYRLNVLLNHPNFPARFFEEAALFQ